MNASPSKLPEATAGTPLWKITAGQFMEHRLALIGLALLILMGSLALAAPLLGRLLGVDPLSQNLAYKLVPPGTIAEQNAHEREAALESWLQASPDAAAKLVRDAAAQGLLTPGDLDEADDDHLEAAMILWEKALADPGFRQVLEANTEPTWLEFNEFLKGRRVRYWLGTDEIGRDILIRLLYGARVSMGVALLAALAAGFIGLVIGTVAGYFGGWTDSILMRLTDALLSLPILPMLIIVAAIHFQKIPLLGRLDLGVRWESIVKVLVILVLFSWMTVARVVRSSVLSVRQQDFVLAAIAVGASHPRTIATHIVPNVMAAFLVAVTLNVGGAIIYEAALSFLGLGIQGPAASWGRMLYDARGIFMDTPMPALLPGSLICLVVISINFVGDGLRDALDPRVIRR